MSSIVEGERECNQCQISETQTPLFDISIPPLIPRQFLCKTCLNLVLDNERKRKTSQSQ